MAAGPATQISDVVVPEVFTPYSQQITEEKARIVQAGALVRDSFLDGLLGGGGLTFNVPSFRDLDNDAENVSTDDISDVVAADYNAGTPNPRLDAVPLKIQTDQEVTVRLSRNAHWSTTQLTMALAGADPMAAIGGRVGYYWTRRLQAAFVAVMTGVIADNTTNDSGDYTNDVSGGSFIDGVTNFTAEAFIDAAVTMGDSAEDLGILMVHSIVYGRMLKNNLIDFIPDSETNANIPFFLGRRVVQDDGMPVNGSVYDSWLFGPGAVRLGVGTPANATMVSRQELAGNGAGQEFLHNRVEWIIHPVGHAYVGTSPNGGPGNGTGANQFANAASWNRVFQDRKQIKFARLVTREA